MNKQFSQVVSAFESANGSYGKAIGLLRELVGHADSSSVKDATKLEKNWQAFLTSEEYKGAEKAAQDLMRKSMQRIRAKCGYAADRKGKISVKKTVTRAPRAAEAKDAGGAIKAHSIASPSEAAKVVASINTWRAAIDAVITAFEGDMPEEVKGLLLKASFFKAEAPARKKATT